MTTNAMFTIFADFNDFREEPLPPPVDEVSPTADEIIGPIREEAWTEGYLTGRHEPTDGHADENLTAKLVTSLHQLDSRTAEAVDAASLVVAELLLNTVIAVASDDWPRKLLSRVRMVADRIKPALTVEPEFLLRDNGGTERRFCDIASLSRALDDGVIGEDVTIKWQRGEATICRTALLEELREAVIPLSASLVNEQNARNPS
jgi:hypothetical protein